LNTEHAAHLFGTVKLSDPLDSVTEVKVVVLNHPESGQTFVGNGGRFDLVANGGEPLVLRFTRQNYLPVDRRAFPVWGSGAHIDDVVMVKLDGKSTSIQINSGSYQEATASTITSAMDPRGQRTARVLFPPNTTATAISATGPGGTTTTLNGPITVRATEFTVGNSATALSRMPAPLPPSVLYTYALEYTIDEALDASSVEFNQPVFAYLENFIGTPTGHNVPDGYYDRDKAAWLPEDNGKALAVVGYDANGAIIDITGDGAETQADTDAWAATTPLNQRLTNGDRAMIATSYPGGTPASPKRIWRVPLTHFSVHDFNHGGGVECVTVLGVLKCPDFASTISGGDDAPQEGSCQRPGSIIGAEDQSLGERLPIMGTPFSLNYKSSYTLGYLPPRGAEVVYNPTPTTLDPKEFRVSLATPGGQFTESSQVVIRPALPKNYISWDGLDGAGRRVNGSQIATIKATQLYSGSYKATGRFGNAADSDSVSSGYALAADSAPDVLYTRVFTKTLSAWGADTLGFGGWTLSAMHVYDPVSGILYQGDGVQRRTFGNRVLRVIGGNGTETPAPSNTLAVNSGIPSQTAAAVASNGDVYLLFPTGTTNRLLKKIVAATGQLTDVLSLTVPTGPLGTSAPHTMAFSPDGHSLYVPAYGEVIRIDLLTNQTSVFAGSAESSYRDGPATQSPNGPLPATFRNIRGVAVGHDGSVYVADSGRIRKIAPDDNHMVTTVAGTGGSGTARCPAANGGPANQLTFGGGHDTTVSVAPDDSLWIGSSYDLINVDAAGRAWCHNMGSREVNSAVAVAADNTVYFGITNQPFDNSLRILKSGSKSPVVPDSETTIITSGKIGEPIDGTVAKNAPIALVPWMSAGPDGSLYFMNELYVSADTWSRRIYQLTPPPKKSEADCAFALPSEDGSQKFCFDKDGRHLSTRNARTDETLLSFHYGSDGLLTDVTDVLDGNNTHISRSPGQVSITGPFGQPTTIALNSATGYAKSITDATNQPTLLSHDAKGLLLSLTDRDGKQHSFAYDSLGRLKKDSNPVGFQTLVRADTADGVPVTSTTVANGYSVSDTSAMGAGRTFAVTVDATGTETRTVTMPDGSRNLSTRSPTGVTTTTFADRRVVKTTSAIDPVTLQDYVYSSETTFPSSLKNTVRHDKTFSPIISTDTLTLNGGPSWTTSFNNSNKTHTSTTPSTTISPAGRTSTVVVDAHDRAKTVTIPGVIAKTYHYDRGRLDSVSQGARLTQLFYYADGTNTPGYLERIKVTDDSGAISTLIVPDQAGRPRHSTTCAMNPSETACASDAIQTDLEWDNEGNLKSVTPPGRSAHHQAFTGTNLLESYSPPAVSDVADPSTSFFYNRDGALEHVQRPGSRRLDYVVDPTTGRLLNDGTTQFAYYPPPPVPPSLPNPGWTPGRLQTAQTGTVLQTFTYDGPLPATETTTWGSGSATITYGFNADLRLQNEAVSITPATGGATSKTTTYNYDLDGLLTCASLSTCDPIATDKLTLNYSGTTGALMSTSFPTASGAITDAYTWNDYGELASYSAKLGSSTLYSVTYDDRSAHVRDGFGRVKRETDQVGNIRDYTYDEQGRLAFVGNGSATLRHYTYDFNGNRLTTNGSSVIAAYDAQDRLTSYDGTTYKYWPNGELRSKTTADGGVTEYNYSPLGYLTSGTFPDRTTFNYAYDGFGRRVQKVVRGTTTRYVYRDRLHLSAVLWGDGNVVSRFVYGSRAGTPDLLLLPNGSVFRIISDQLGSPRVVVAVSASGIPAGTIVRTIDYDEFGNRTVTTNTGVVSDLELPLGFAGGLYDTDTGLVHFGARDYDPSVARWISKDPILFRGGQANLYVYANNDAINRIDPSGLDDGTGGASSVDEGGSEGAPADNNDSVCGGDDKFTKCYKRCMDDAGADYAAAVFIGLTPFAPTPKTPWELSKTMGGGASMTTWASRLSAWWGLKASNSLRSAGVVAGKLSALPYAFAGGYYAGSAGACAASCG